MVEKIKCNWCESVFVEGRLMILQKFNGDYVEKCPVCGHSEYLQDFKVDFQDLDASAKNSLYRKLEHEQRKGYFHIIGNGESRLMYGTEAECMQYCKAKGYTYKEKSV